ncbi:MAG TPA: zinc-binding dehydrogenase [Acidimicrobiia bacterium]|nr:zinc-binding dehydrogenase [Acidimicrobiia bacterium]
MKAWLLTDTSGIDAFELQEVDTPEPGSGEVRIELKTSGLNHLDLWVSQGLPAPKHLPHILGADGAGVVDKVGDGVDGIGVGDEVVIDPSISCGGCAACLRDEIVFCSEFGILGEHHTGTLAEYVTVPAANALPRPLSLNWETAGSFGLVTGTALRMLDRARLEKGESVLVPGIGGGVSSAAMLLAIARGARVFVTSRSPAKIQWAVEQGAEAGFDSGSEFSKEMKSHGGADVVVEDIGPATWEQSLRSLKPGGRMVVCGATSGQKVELKLPVLWFKQLELIGSSMATHSQFSRALHLVSTGQVPAPVDSVFAFDRLPDALRHLESAEQTGKVVISH